YRIILFDQRGAGKSLPYACIEHNSTPDLIADIEILRQHLNIAQWLVFGGSWGSTLALAYGQAHPERCLGFVLRGIFLGRAQEREWFLRGMRTFQPQAWAEFVRFLPPAERADLLGSYYQRLCSDEVAVHEPAAIAWARYEYQCAQLQPVLDAHIAYSSADKALAVARLEAHYMIHDCFLRDNQLLEEVPRLRHLPCTIVQGRYDVVCPPLTAYELARAWPEATFHVSPISGHTALEPETQTHLLNATDEFAQRHR
ncbi:MAG: prolyl aminopeptidase, partial [Pseudomonadota bacterium]